MNTSRREVSLRARVIGMIVLVGVIATVGAFGVTQLVVSLIEGSVDRSLTAAATTYEQTRALFDVPAEPDNPQSVGLGTLSFEVTDEHGQVIERTGQQDAPQLKDISTTGFHTISDWRVLVLDRPDGGRLAVATDETYLSELAWVVRASVGIMLAMILLSLALAMLWLLRSVVRPLDTLVDTAKKVTAGDSSVRVESEMLLPEAAKVGEALNQMLDTQQDSLNKEQAAAQRMRAFIADASHELRTPLTTISGWATLLENPKVTSDKKRTGVQRIRTETDRMSRLVENLLVLARSDTKPGSADPECDLSQAVKGVWLDHTVLDPTRPVTLDLPKTARVQVSCDALSQIMTNILANLRAHTKEGTTASVTVKQYQRWATLVYQDDGVGVPKDSPVFERFWQANTSRSTPGTGLGLSVVQALVSQFAGEVEVSSGLDGFRLELKLPSALSPTKE